MARSKWSSSDMAGILPRSCRTLMTRFSRQRYVPEHELEGHIHDPGWSGVLHLPVLGLAAGRSSRIREVIVHPRSSGRDAHDLIARRDQPAFAALVDEDEVVVDDKAGSLEALQRLVPLRVLQGDLH